MPRAPSSSSMSAMRFFAPTLGRSSSPPHRRTLLPGVRINGVDVVRILEDPDGVDPDEHLDPAQHPAVKRIIGLGQR